MSDKHLEAHPLFNPDDDQNGHHDDSTNHQFSGDNDFNRIGNIIDDSEPVLNNLLQIEPENIGHDLQILPESHETHVQALGPDIIEEGHPNLIDDVLLTEASLLELGIWVGTGVLIEEEEEAERKKQEQIEKQKRESITKLLIESDRDDSGNLER